MQTLQERLNEVIGELGVSPAQFRTLVRNNSGKRHDEPINNALDGKPLQFRILERISSSVGLVPVVFFWQGMAVNLGYMYEGFLKGEDVVDVEYYVGESIRRHRSALGLTQEQLAKRAGVSTSYMSQVENGKRYPPSTEIIDRIVPEIGLDRKYLFEPQTEVNQLVHSVVVGGYAGAIDAVSQRLEGLPEGSQYGLLRLERLVKNVDKFKARLGEIG